WTIGTIHEPQTQKIHAGRENSVIRRLSTPGSAWLKTRLMRMMIKRRIENKYGSGVKGRINRAMP
ncbi:TPA: hypothetical protein ACPFQA_004170, partial [Citrobacter braakii]